jgi:hypothetical protein
MLKFLERPKTVSFAQNPIVYRLKAVNATDEMPYRAKGARATLAVTNNFLSEGDTLTLSFTEPDSTATSVTFTATATPTLATHVPTGIALSTVARYVARHPYIAPRLRITYAEIPTNHHLIAECKDVAPSWSVTWTFAFIDPLTIAINTSEPFSLSDEPDGYHIAVQVFFERIMGAGDWYSVFNGAILSRADGGELAFSISSVLAAECAASLRENPFSKYQRNSPTLTDNVRQYYVQWKEVFVGAAPEWQRDNIKMVVMGGVPNSVWLSKSNWFTFGAAELDRTWFSYMPSQKRVRFSFVEWLTWWNLTDEKVEVQLRVEVFTSNGALLPSIVVNTLSEAPAHRAMTFAVQPDALQLPEDTLYYTVQVVTADVPSNVGNFLVNTPLSSPRLFQVDAMPRRNMRQLAYINQFGCPETWTCTGEFSKNMAVASETTETVRGVNYGGAVTRQDRFLNSIDLTYIYRSGNVNADTKEVLTELALSPVLFDTTTLRYMALTLEAKRANATGESIGSTDENIYGWEWTTRPRIELNAFAPDRILRGSDSLAEPVQALGQLTDDGDTPIDFTPDDGAIPTDILEVGELTESDLIVFAKLNPQGQVAGFYTFKSGKYMRLVRGLALNAPSHLDAIAFKNGTDKTFLSIDTLGAPEYQTV